MHQSGERTGGNKSTSFSRARGYLLRHVAEKIGAYAIVYCEKFVAHAIRKPSINLTLNGNYLKNNYVRDH